MSPSRRTATLGRFSKCRVPTGPTIPAIHICAYTPAAWTPARAQPVTPRLGICYSIVISPASRMVSFFDSSKHAKPQKAPLRSCFLFNDFGFCRRFSQANLPAPTQLCRRHLSLPDVGRESENRHHHGSVDRESGAKRSVAIAPR